MRPFVHILFAIVQRESDLIKHKRVFIKMQIDLSKVHFLTAPRICQVFYYASMKRRFHRHFNVFNVFILY